MFVIWAGCTAPHQTNARTRPEAGPSTAALFAEKPGTTIRTPARIAVGSDGTIYVSDPEANLVTGEHAGVRVIELTGLDRPLGIAVSGNKLYVGNGGHHNVEVYDLTSRKLIGALGAVDMPNAISVAPDGVVYVADSTKDVVRVFEGGHWSMDLGGTGTGAGQLRFPVAVAADATRVVVGDQANHRLQVFDRAGKFVRSIGDEATSAENGFCGHFNRVQGIALSGDTIYVLDAYHGHVVVLSGDGTCQGLMGHMGNCPTCVGLALDVAVKLDGKLLLTDPDHKRLITLSEEVR